MEEDLEKIKKWYELSWNTAGSAPPRRGLFNSKCPKCGARLKKEKIVRSLYGGEGAEDFADKVLHDHGASSGVYSLTINHFTCNCGYVFADRRLDEIESES